jgi:nucleoside-diphosphate-sugar epimerase
MKVLLTGGSGFIGRYVLQKLLQRNHNVVSLGRKEILLNHPNHTHQYIDLNNFKGFDFSSFDCVVHLAGIASGEGQDYESYYKFNFLVTNEFIKAIKKTEIKFLYASSASVYGERTSDTHEFIEEDPLNGSTDYAKSKIMAERNIQDNLENFLIFRIASVYGNGGKGFVNKLVQFLKRKIYPVPLGSLGSLKSFIHVEDLSEMIVLGVDSENKGLYNLSYPKGVSYIDLINEIKAHTGKISMPIYLPKFLLTLETILGRESKSKIRPLFQQSVINPNKFLNDFGFSPKYSINDGIKTLFQ